MTGAGDDGDAELEAALKAFGERLRASRERVPLTQLQVAELVDANVSTVSRWERGEAYPQGAQLVRLSQVLGESLDHLMLGSDARTPTVMPKAFVEFLGTKLGRIAQEQGLVLTLLSVRPMGTPTVRFYTAIVAGLLSGSDE